MILKFARKQTAVVAFISFHLIFVGVLLPMSLYLVNAVPVEDRRGHGIPGTRLHQVVSLHGGAGNLTWVLGRAASAPVP